MRRLTLCALLGFALLGAPRPASALPIFVDFELFADLDVLTTQIAGASFTNAVVLSSGATGGSLNELDFPPRSGDNVIFDSGASISISFTTPLQAFSAYLTYVAPVTLSAFDAAGNSLGSVSTLFGSNYVSGGGTPNELIALSEIGLISRIELLGAGTGGSFVLDDLTFDTDDTVNARVPEPGTLLLFGVGLAAASRARFLRFRSR